MQSAADGQSYLLSIRPFLKLHPSRAAAAEKGPAPVDEKAQTSGGAVQGAEEDEVFHWGRQVDVDWRMVSWVTVRDQVCFFQVELMGAVG